ncbi:MAG TPA: IS110 family transposase [Anaeromyxobacteraceae bacterium]|nr:IS110 family transposase [Anaeromyxobacteraceae bacterium]
MKKRNAVFVGCDLGDKFSEICVLDQVGAVLARERVRTTNSGLTKVVAHYASSVVVIEVGVHSRWVEELFRSLGHRVVVANPRQVRLIWKRRLKTDRSDAMLLARLGRVDLTLLAPVQQRGRDAQLDLVALRSRDILVRSRTRLINHVRGVLKQFGLRVRTCGSSAFAKHANEVVPIDLMPALEPALRSLHELDEQITVHDRQIDELAAASPTAQHLMQVTGVGALTALAFCLTIDDPHRFKRSRLVGAFLGLTPAKDQSGESDPEKHISKAGNPFLRRLLVQSAQHILGPCGRESDLRTWGKKLVARGGQAATKRAIVAVARKLAVLLHRLWVTGEAYDPQHYSRCLAA